MATSRQAKPLQDILIEQGALTREQLQAAQAQAAKTGSSLKQIIVQQGLMTDEDLTALVAAQSGVTSIDLSNYLWTFAKWPQTGV